jgi:hypothetical protein
MADASRADVTVLDVLEVLDATIRDAASVADATGLTLEQLRAATFGGMGADQARAMAAALHRSTDELLAIASQPADELDRRKARARATTDLEDAAMVLASHARGAAHLLRQWCYADGSDSDSGAALDLLADALEDAAEGVEDARARLDGLGA